MSATYDPMLSRDLDWVRFLIRDVVTTRPMMSDEEILGILAAQTAVSNGSMARRYFTAAECLAILHSEYMTAGKGKASKKISQLQIVYGTSSGINADLALQSRISELRKLGARFQSREAGRSHVFRMLGVLLALLVLPAAVQAAVCAAPIVLRSEKGSQLTSAEGDQNFTQVRLMCNEADAWLTTTTGDGRYSLLGHTHVAANITDFSTALRAITDPLYTPLTVVPSTAPTDGQLLVGNTLTSAYAPRSISGDFTLSATGVATLASVIAGTSCGDGTHSCTVTFDTKGRATSVSNTSINFPPAVFGSDTQVTFNDAGTMSGNAAFTFAKATGTVSATKLITQRANAMSLLFGGTTASDVGFGFIGGRLSLLGGNYSGYQGLDGSGFYSSNEILANNVIAVGHQTNSANSWGVLYNNAFWMGSGVKLGWTSTALPSGAAYASDTGLSRSAAGTVSVDTTAAGNGAGTLTAATVNAGNLRATGNTLSSTNTNGDIAAAPNGTGRLVVGPTSSTTGHPLLVLSGSNAAGWGQRAANAQIWTFYGDGTSSFPQWEFNQNFLESWSSGVLAWSNGTYTTIGTNDTGISRGAAGQVNVGNGTAGNASGTLAANTVTTNGLRVQGTGSAQSYYFTDVNNNIAYMQTDTDSTHAWTLNDRTATKVPLQIIGASAQSADLFQITANAGTAGGLFKVGSAGTVTTQAVALPRGAASPLPFSISDNGTNGLYAPTNSSLCYVDGYGNKALCSITPAGGTVPGVTTVPSTGSYAWTSSTTDATGTKDTILSRPSAGTVSVDTTAANASGNAVSQMWWVTNDGGTNNVGKLENDAGHGRVVLDQQGSISFSSTANVNGLHQGDIGLSRSGSNTLSVDTSTRANGLGTAQVTTVKSPAGGALGVQATAPAAAAASQAGVATTISASAAVDGSSTHALAVGGNVNITTGAGVNGGNAGDVVITTDCCNSKVRSNGNTGLRLQGGDGAGSNTAPLSFTAGGTTNGGDFYFGNPGASAALHIATYDTWDFWRPSGGAAKLRLYSTSSTIGASDPTNYERLSFTGTAGSGFTIAAQSAGTGAASLNLTLAPKGSGGVVMPSGTHAARPATCTTGAIYTETDTPAICACTATDTWKCAGLL